MFRSMMNFASASGDFCSNDNECHCIIIFPGGRLSKNVLAHLYEIYIPIPREIGGTFLFCVRQNLTRAPHCSVIQLETFFAVMLITEAGISVCPDVPSA
jgi:hypothetical protein